MTIIPKMSVYYFIVILFFFIAQTSVFGQSSSSIYCDSYATSTGYEEIVVVTIGTWSNNSAPAIGTGYTNFTSVPPPFLIIGNTYSISIETDLPPGYTFPSYNCWVKVYIDFNNDSIYTEPGEIAFSSPIQSQATATGSFMVPVGSISSNTGMRVVFEETSIATDITPCGTYTWGETEDYLVLLAPQIPNDVGVISIVNPINNLIENIVSPVEVTVMNYGTDTIFNMEIEYAVDGGITVTTSYVGPLAPAAQENVVLPNLIIPGGFYSICAFTVLAGDSNTYNDEICESLFATPQFEAGMLSFDSPEAGCDLAFEDVTVSLVNLGDTIDIGNLELSYSHIGITAVTEVYPNVVLPLDTVTYIFATQVDLSVTAGAIFEFLAWVDLVGDPTQTNDTVATSVWSGLTPPSPISNNITIWSGEFGTLNVTNLDTTLMYSWYDVDTNLVGDEFTYTSPVLFDTTSYYVSSATGVLAGSSMTTSWANNNGSTGNMFDITALNILTIDSFDINGDNSGLMEVWYRPGTCFGFNTSNVGWTFVGSYTVSSAGAGNPTSLPVGGITIPAGETYGICVTYVSGNINYIDGTSTNQVYSNTDMTYTAQYGGNYFNYTYYPRVFSGNIHYTAGVVGCESSLIPVNIIVEYAGYDAATWNMTSPVTGTYLGMEDVTVEVYNNGLNPIGNFPVFYTINGGTAVVDTFTNTIAPGMMEVFTFATQADLTTFTNYSIPPYDICVFTGLVNDGLTSNDTLCAQVENLSCDCVSCVTPYSYGDINDPAVFSATLLPYDSHWWKFDLGATYNDVVVSLCSSGFDTKLEVYSDCNSSYIGYNDDYCGTSSQLNFSYLSAGTYYAKVYGYSTGYGSYTLSITSSYCCYIPPLTPTNVSCNGATDGSVDFTGPITTGVPPFIYNWSNGQTTEDITGLPAGVYSLTVTDATGTEFIDNVTVSEPSEILVSLFGTDVSTIGGNNGAIDLWVIGGVPPYTFLWSNGETTEDLTATYGGYYSVTVTDANGCMVTESIFINAPLPSSWNVISSTDYHLIDIPETAVISIDAVNIVYGSYIGVFCNSGGVLTCGGFAVWSGSNTQVVAYSNNNSGNVGFDLGETFIWKIWNVDSMMYGEYFASPVYSSMYPDQGQFVNNGSSGILSLESLSYDIQYLNLPEGWSFMSTFIDPFEPQIDSIFASIVTQLIICKDGNGSSYWPAYGVDLIDSILIGDGYQVKMISNQVLTVEGVKVIPEITFVDIPQGWSYLGYLRTNAGPIINMLYPVIQDIVIVKDDNGSVYWPAYNVNLIGNMIPGKGYQIKMNSTQTFSFPAN